MRQKRKYPVGARLYIKLRETSCTSRRSFPQDAPRVHRHLHNVGRWRHLRPARFGEAGRAAIGWRPVAGVEQPGDPAYPGPRAPPIFKALQSIVKADVIVAPTGKVQSIEVKGGHPVLAQAARDALRQRKWESAAHETHKINRDSV
jgi:hypothetical protein